MSHDKRACGGRVCRYFVITRPFQYAMKRTPVRMMAMIAAAWLLSALISIPPLLFDRSPEVQPDQCPEVHPQPVRGTHVPLQGPPVPL